MTAYTLLALAVIILSCLIHVVDAGNPTAAPSTGKPTKKPDAGQPTHKPTSTPTNIPPPPSPLPANVPTHAPSKSPNYQLPTHTPSELPTGQPTSMPSTLSENEDHSEDYKSYSDDIIAAAKSGAVSIVADFIDKMGVEEATKSNFAYTAVATAILGGYLPVVKIIYDKTKISINTSGKSGNTALMWASYYGNIDAVQYFLENEADFTIRNDNGDTALSLARNAGYTDVVLLLRTHGALS